MQAAAQMAEALECCRRGEFDRGVALLRTLTHTPGVQAEALNNLGVALMNQGHHQQAEAAFRDALSARSDYAEAWGNLGSVLSIQGYKQGPLQAFAKALQLAPRDLHLVQRAGRELLDLGYTDVARRCYAIVLKHHPDDVEAIAGLANVAEHAGDLDEAERLLRPWVGHLSPNAAAAWARVCQRQGRPEAGVAPIRRLLDQGLAPLFEAHLLYTLGDLLDRMEDWEGAFHAYERANQLQQPSYDPLAHEAEINAIIEAPRPTPLTDRGEHTVLIVGMPRSGTSLVEQVLASHPAVHGAGEREELRLLSLQLALETARPWTEAVGSLNVEQAHARGAWYERRLATESGAATYITDKMPANALYLGLAARVLPQARVIRCVRDPVDTGLSCFFQQFHHAHTWSTRLDWIGQRHREHDRLMAHWEAVLPLPMLTVRYADMVTDFEAQSRRLVEFLDLDWDEACLRFHTQRRFVSTASYSQVQQPIYSRSLGRAQNYRKWTGPLRSALQGS